MGCVWSIKCTASVTCYRSGPAEAGAPKPALPSLIVKMSAAYWQSWSQTQKLESESYVGRVRQIWARLKFFYCAEDLLAAGSHNNGAATLLLPVLDYLHLPSFEALLGDLNTPGPQETLESATIRGLSGINTAGVDGKWHLLSPTRDHLSRIKVFLWAVSSACVRLCNELRLATEFHRKKPDLLLAPHTMPTWHYCRRKYNCRSVSHWLFVVVAAANPCFHWLFRELKV